MPETWATLQRLAIDDAHPAWFAPLDEPLLARARASSPVRRLLARTLAEGPAPLLFGTIAPALPSVVVRQGWWRLPAEALRRIALLLGAIAFAPAIRTRIDRLDVLRLRRVLGMRRYGEALNATRLSQVDAAAIQRQLDAAMRDDETLREALTRRGWSEWTGFASEQHPLLVERLHVCAGPDSGNRDDEGTRWLSSAAIATCLAGIPLEQTAWSDPDDRRDF